MNGDREPSWNLKQTTVQICTVVIRADSLRLFCGRRKKQEGAVKAAYVKNEDFNRLEMSHREMAAHVVALTAVVAGIATAGAVDYERLEECVNFAAKTLRLGARPGLLAKASAVLGDIEKMQKALQIENRKNRGFRNEPFPKA
jgi:hypothetical protein